MGWVTSRTFHCANNCECVDLCVAGVVDTGVAEQGEYWEECVAHLREYWRRILEENIGRWSTCKCKPDSLDV